MYGREELEEIPMTGWECYDKEEADQLMDVMEKQIRTLENDKEEMYEANLVLQARIKELEENPAMKLDPTLYPNCNDREKCVKEKFK